MRRKIALAVIMPGFVVLLLAFAWLVDSTGPSPGQAVSLYIEGFTNAPGFPNRMAWMVITNHSSTSFRLLAWNTFVGPPPVPSPQQTSSLDGVFSLLPGQSSMRVLISAPTNGQLWSGNIRIAYNLRSYQIGQNLLHSSSDLVKGTASLLIPPIRVEELYTSPRTD